MGLESRIKWSSKTSKPIDIGGITKVTIGLDQVDNTADAEKPISSAQQAALDGKASTGALAAKADLVMGKVPASQLPVNGSYLGAWNASTNSPTIVSGVGTNGDFYIVGTAGTTSIDGIATWGAGDQIRFNGTVWQRVPLTNAVASVAGQTGVVTLAKGDVGLGSVDNTSDVNKPVSSAQATAIGAKVSTVGGAIDQTLVTGKTQTGSSSPFVAASPAYNTLKKPAQIGLSLVDDATAGAANRLKLIAALNDPYGWVDGDGLTIAVSGNVEATSCRIANMTLKQKAPGGVSVRTLFFSGRQNVKIKEVRLDMGGDFSTGDTGNYAGIFLTNCPDADIDDVWVFNGGPICGIKLVNNCHRMRLNKVRVFDMRYVKTTEVLDDILMGINIGACAGGSMKDCRVDLPDIDTPDALTNSHVPVATGVVTPIRRYTRCYGISGWTNAVMEGCAAYGGSQGFDITGGGVPLNFRMSDCYSLKGYTWGFKFANGQQRAVIDSCIAEQSGSAGFVVSPTIPPATNNASALLFTGCKAFEIGNGAFATPAGLKVLTNTGHLVRGVKVVDFECRDERPTPLCEFPAINYVPIAQIDDGDIITETGTKAKGMVISNQTIGFHKLRISAIKTSADTNVADSTWTDIQFDISDGDKVTIPAGPGQPGTNAYVPPVPAATSPEYDPSDVFSGQNYTVKRPGRYRVEADLYWAANTNNYRQMRVLKSGAAFDGNSTIQPAFASSAAGFYQRIAVEESFALNDVIKLQGWQNSGGSLGYRAGSRMRVIPLD